MTIHESNTEVARNVNTAFSQAVGSFALIRADVLSIATHAIVNLFGLTTAQMLQGNFTPFPCYYEFQYRLSILCVTYWLRTFGVWL